MSQTAPGRSPLDLPDARQYTSFWWDKNDAKCFGFVLTPRQGRELRSNPPAQVRAHVVSTFCDGAFEVVTAFIPGETDQEVVVLSHLCHPQPSANDNASGAAATIEIAATLHELIADGLLPPPRHGIRFLWMPEMTGTFAYLSTFEDRLPRMIAGVNLDMVGQDQDRCHSTFNIEQPPASMASFAPVLLARLWDGLMRIEADSTPVSLLALYATRSRRSAAAATTTSCLTRRLVCQRRCLSSGPIAFTTPRRIRSTRWTRRCTASAAWLQVRLRRGLCRRERGHSARPRDRRAPHLPADTIRTKCDQRRLSCRRR